MSANAIFITFLVFFSIRRRHTRCALVTGVQTCALPIFGPAVQLSATDHDLTAAFGAECQCSGEGAVQTAERCQPPSTNIHSPVMYPAWREQRKATVLPISSGVP